jgi:Family of unknown function (DUF6433)
MRLALFQILEEASKLKSNQEKIDYLRAQDNKALLAILKYAYDPTIVWDLPEGAPPYKPCPYPAQEMRLMSEIRRLYLFIKGGNPNLTKLKREALYIELLESVHPQDAELLVAIKDKKIPYKGITAKLVKEAFPGLIEELSPNETSVDPKE